MNATTQGSLNEIQTVNELFLRVADAKRRDAMLFQDETGAWQSISSTEVYRRVRALAKAFLDWGIERGDRIAILSENRWEWAVTDFAVLAIGAVDVPIYPTLTSEQIGALLLDSGARIAVVSSHALYDKIEPIRSQTHLEHVVMMDTLGAPEGVELFSMLTQSLEVRVEDRDPEFDALVRSAKPEELATLIYTSGTTGEPKGVMLTHGNLASNTSYATRDFSFGPGDSSVSYLPLSHITARALDYAMYFFGAQVAYCTFFDKLIEALKEVKPTVFVGVPRVYEKIRHGVQQKSAASPLKAKILAWAVQQGAPYGDLIHDRKEPGSLKWKLAKKLVYGKIREAFGGRITTFISGGAPLGLDTGNWFASVGISVLEGYGLSETSPVIAINTPLKHRMGSVGKPLPNVECKIAADGELLVRGPGIFQGYWHKEQATQEAMADGWFATGDIAKIDNDGFLFITDRKKELLKTSGGKLIAPQPIEGKLKANVLVAEAAMVGDRHKFACVLIAPNFAALEAWAKQQGVSAANRQELVADAKVLALYEEIVTAVNATLANFETMKRFRLVAEEWTLPTGELTPSMKLKRRVITARYAALIEGLYADEATTHGG
ncbi:MAG TPA: long-chain fatty acid--CoA ligase [Acidobacteriaceae bacterium]|nr:long-chain fatty acid--CoA ligase [Acidobacteriaceae bacterium]